MLVAMTDVSFILSSFLDSSRFLESRYYRCEIIYIQILSVFKVGIASSTCVWRLPAEVRKTY